MKQFQPNPNTKASYSAIVDGLRIIVSLLLAFGHLGLGKLISELTSNVLLSGFASAIFFMLSGFVIANSSLFRESWYTFAVKRVARLWPPHVVAVLVYVPFLTLGADRLPIQESIELFAVWLMGLQGINAHYSFGYNINPPAWSVTALLLGGILLPLLSWMNIRKYSTRWLWTITVVLVVGRLGFEVVQGMPMPHEIDTRHIAILPRIMAMFAGALTAILVQREANAPQLQWLRTDLAFYALTATIVAMLYVTGYFLGRPGLYMVAHGGMSIPSLMLICAAFLNQGSLRTFFSRPIFKLGADLSIYIFLFHIPVADILGRVAGRLSVNGQPLFTIDSLFGIALTIVVTCLVSYWFAPIGKRMQQATANALMRFNFAERQSAVIAKSATLL